MSRFVNGLILLLTLGLFLAWGSFAFAQGFNYADIEYARQTGRLPVTVSLDDDFSFKYRNARIYGCIQDRATGQRWAGWGPITSLQRYAVIGEWPFGAGTVTTFADRRVCWPDWPETVGEPAYWTLHWLPGPVRADTIDFTRTNAPENIAGTTVAGEQCDGATNTTGYHLILRLATNGRVPVTRCRVP